MKEGWNRRLSTFQTSLCVTLIHFGVMGLKWVVKTVTVKNRLN